MQKKIKNIISKIDRYLFKIFGSDKSIKLLQNIKEAQIIFSILNKTGEESRVRFVGGCVRKALMGEDVDDIDLATSLKPDEVKKILIEKNIKVFETGISHGTLTIVINKKTFEITTLRKDVSTDGRHADVEYTLDWKEDATRRDFTINAIYADIEGRIFDPFNGTLDLKNGKINFIFPFRKSDIPFCGSKIRPYKSTYIALIVKSLRKESSFQFKVNSTFACLPSVDISFLKVVISNFFFFTIAVTVP